MGMGTHKIKGEDYYQCRDVKAERDKLLEEVAELLGRLESAEKERDDVAMQLAQSEQGKRKISEECDTLLARIEQMEKQEPVDLSYIELMNSAQKIVESYVYFRRFIASTPLENDIAVWMADFVFAQIDAKGE